MKGIQLRIKGNWAHFKKPETNNNPLSHDIITKTALIGMIGAVIGIERDDMKELFPQLSEDLLYGVQLEKNPKKVSWGFTSKSAYEPVSSGSPKYFEFLKSPSFIVTLAIRSDRSLDIFDKFSSYVKEEKAVYTPILGWHNCPAELEFISESNFLVVRNGKFKTKGFVCSKGYELHDISGEFRIGFDRVPTFQDNDMWNHPDKYVEIVYPDASQQLSVEGEYFEFNTSNSSERWCLI
ncbi:MULTISPECIES: CRISPR-associated protein Cas5 [unclassified Saccharicrinis]|uniref:CRISPR-associated protein Cas5 n=1 Tax=unclassified Saccharicrinis TaxID=2646859 RepID=UPI003D32D6FF